MVKDLSGERALDWKQVPEVKKALGKLDQLKTKLPELTSRVETAKAKAEAAANHFDECDLDFRVQRISAKQRDGSKEAADRALDAFKQTQAEAKAVRHDLDQQEKAVARIVPDAMRLVAKNLREDQLEDEKKKLALLEEVVAIDERQNARLGSAQRQFRFSDHICSEAGISAAAGVPRFVTKGIARSLLERQQSRARAFEAQLKVEEVA